MQGASAEARCGGKRPSADTSDGGLPVRAQRSASANSASRFSRYDAGAKPNRTLRSCRLPPSSPDATAAARPSAARSPPPLPPRALAKGACPDTMLLLRSCHRIRFRPNSCAADVLVDALTFTCTAGSTLRQSAAGADTTRAGLSSTVMAVDLDGFHEVADADGSSSSLSSITTASVGSLTRGGAAAGVGAAAGAGAAAAGLTANRGLVGTARAGAASTSFVKAAGLAGIAGAAPRSAARAREAGTTSAKPSYRWYAAWTS